MRTVRRKQIPNLLRKQRKLAGYRQKDVANMLNLKSASMISRWEKGAVAPSLLNLLKLSIIYSTLCDRLYDELVGRVRKAILVKKENVVRREKGRVK